MLRSVGFGGLVLLTLLHVTVPARAEDANGGGGSDEEALLAEFEAEHEELVGFPDPWEPANRGMLYFNEGLDRWLIAPIVHAYRFIVPEPPRRCVGRFLFNLKAPSILVNDMLQREWTDAGVTLGRFVTNTTIGIGGLFDPAKKFGLKKHDSDFGQTLALEGVPSGPYIVLPLLGPTTARDGFGTAVDIFFRPTTYLIGPIDQLFYYSIHGGSQGLVQREQEDRALQALRESSVDYYAALRNAFFQYRTAFIWRRERERGAAGVAVKRRESGSRGQEALIAMAEAPPESVDGLARR